MPETLSTVLILLVFVIPGFLAARVFSRAYPRTEPGESRMVLESIALSSVSYGIFSWLYVLAWKGRWYENSYLLALLIFFAVFLAPILVALGLIWTLESNSARSLLHRSGLAHPTPKAWDHFFRKGIPCWVVATMKDGRLVAGLYGGDSFASSFPAKEDLYLEKLCTLSPEGRIRGLAQFSLGAIIQMEQVELLEFYQLKELQHDQ